MDTLGPFVEIGRKGEFRYSVEVRPIAPAPSADIRYSAKPKMFSSCGADRCPRLLNIRSSNVRAARGMKPSKGRARASKAGSTTGLQDPSERRLGFRFALSLLPDCAKARYRHAAIGVWHSPRQWGCQRYELIFARP